MKHITEVLVYKNRCEVFNQHTYTQGDVGIPHIKLIFKYLFEEQSLQGKQLECKYILPNGEYSVKTVNVTEKDCVVFPIHYSVLQIAGWTTLKATLVCDSGRITLDDILIKTKSCKLGQLNTTPQVTQAIKYEIDEIKAFTETKKKEVTNHTTQEITRVTKATDSEIARVANEGKTQVQVLKNQSNGVLPRIEKLEDGARQDNLCSYSVDEPKDDEYFLIKTSAPYGETIMLSVLIEGRGIVSREFTDSTTIKIGSYYYGGEIYGPRCLITTNRSISNDYPIYVCEYEGKIAYVFKVLYYSSFTVSCLDMKSNSPSVHTVPKGEWIAKIIKKAELDKIKIKKICEQTTVITDKSEILNKKADRTGSTFTGLVAIKKDTNGEAMVALNSAYGNGDIYSGGSAKGVGFKNRTSKKGLFLGDDGSVKLEARNLKTISKDVVNSINTAFNSYVMVDGVGYNDSDYFEKIIKSNQNGSFYTGSKQINGLPANQTGYRNLLFSRSDDVWQAILGLEPFGNTSGNIFYATATTGVDINDIKWVKIWHSGVFDPSAKLDKSSVVNDLVAGGEDKPLSAEQGKLLKQEIEALKQQIAQLKK